MGAANYKETLEVDARKLRRMVLGAVVQFGIAPRGWGQRLRRLQNLRAAPDRPQLPREIRARFHHAARFTIRRAKVAPTTTNKGNAMTEMTSQEAMQVQGGEHHQLLATPVLMGMNR